MPIKILMPALSPTMTEGNLAKWLKKEGDRVKPGDVIAEIETDKATMEMEVVDEGVLAKIIIPSGSENVAVNALVAVLLEDGEDASLLEDFCLNHSSSVAPALPLVEVAVESSLEAAIKEEAQDIKKDQARIFASPLAKRIAEEQKIDLLSITGTGPHGRIIKADLLKIKQHKTPAIMQRQDTIIPHTNVRKIIAKRLLESKQTIPHFYLSIECIISKLLELRAEMNSASDKYKLSVNDFVTKAVALALRDVPNANASWDDKGTILYGNVDVSVAVATQGGLVTPVIRSADQKSLINLSNEIKELASRARENKLRPEEFQGGGFTISNLGMYGIKNFSAIINPPQSCILAVGAGTKRPVVDVDGDSIAIETVMDVTLSCDHRVVDGAVGAEFLAAFKGYIENPIKILLTEIA